jgi:hypothetical protein
MKNLSQGDSQQRSAGIPLFFSPHYKLVLQYLGKQYLNSSAAAGKLRYCPLIYFLLLLDRYGTMLIVNNAMNLNFLNSPVN